MIYFYAEEIYLHLEKKQSSISLIYLLLLYSQPLELFNSIFNSTA